MKNTFTKENNNIIANIDEIIAKSMESQENRKLLAEMFPQVFQLDKKFCEVGDILLRKGKNAFYALTWLSSEEIGIMNLQYGKGWDNRLKVNRTKIEDRNQKVFITRRDFEMLSKHYFSDFVVLPKENVIAQYGK